MSDGTSRVIDELRRRLADPAGFLDVLRDRVHQLGARMVDGQLIPPSEAAALRSGIVDLVRGEAIARLRGRRPKDALAALDVLRAFQWTELEGERAGLEAERAARFPPPPPVAWPELQALQAAAIRYPDACRVAPPCTAVDFAEDLAEAGVRLPEELLGLYAACDGFDLACRRSSHIPVLALLPSGAIEIEDERGGYPRRAVVFHGDDEIQLSVFSSGSGEYCLAREYDFEPEARRPLDLPKVLAFGLDRMNAPDPKALSYELSWARFFDG